MFNTKEEFYNRLNTLGKASVQINENIKSAAKEMLFNAVDIYEAYLMTPTSYIEDGMVKYHIPLSKTIGTIFLLIMLGSNSFKASDKRWNSLLYGQLAKILTFWIENKFSLKQARTLAENKSKSSILKIISNSGLVNDKPKQTEKEFKIINKAKSNNPYLLYVDAGGNCIVLPDIAISILKQNKLL